MLSEYAENFWVGNVAELKLPPSSYDFIFFDPYHVHPDDLAEVVNMILGACRPGGKVIFYTYRDVLRMLRLIGLLRFKWIEWVGDLLPPHMKGRLKRIDHKEVSIGVYKCSKAKVKT